MRYHKEIQILRGIAVGLVVLFHLDVAWFKSGFLGVDVFFVISGYLMAIMYDPAEKAVFYLKRAKRLLPAYFAVVAATLIAAPFITTPSDFNQVSIQAMFATFFASNIGFWMENSYFDKSAFKPLLHLWSLGVELQFYFSVPFVYWAVKRYKFGYFILLLSSCSLCFFVDGISPKTAFFWLPFRLWEFLLGFGVARLPNVTRESELSARSWIGAFGVAAIISIPVYPVDGGALGFVSGHPGVIAFLISVATATAIYFGLPKTILDGQMAGLLERLGNYSYSIYLVHFPIIVLFLYRPFSGTVLKATSTVQIILLAFLIAGAAVLLYKYVEQPFRKCASLFSLALVVPITVLGISVGGPLIQRMFMPSQELAIFQAWEDRDTYRCGKLARILKPMAISCEITAPIAMPDYRVLLVGNSHADSIKASFSATAQEKNITVFFMVENNPLMPGGIGPELLVREARRLNVDGIVLHYSPGGISPSVVNQVVGLAKESGIQVSFILPVPVWTEHVPMALWKHQKQGLNLPSQHLSDYLDLNSDLVQGVAKIGYKNFKTYPVADVFCATSCALMSSTGKPLYFDGGHLTLTGAQLLHERFGRLMDDLLLVKSQNEIDRQVWSPTD